MGTFKEIFEEYGADYQGTMERFMGNEKLYLRLLDMLFEDKSLEKLGAAIAERDMPGAFEAAHTLKGVVGNMGLEPLYHAVCGIVEPLRAEESREDYPVLYQAVQMEFERTDGLRKKLKGGEGA